MVQKENILILTEEKVQEVKNLGRGVFAPLRGFLKKGDLETVCKEMRLANGKVWPIPIILDVSEEEAERLEGKDRIFLLNKAQELIGILEKFEIYQYDKKLIAKKIFGTTNKKHPGVKDLYQMKDCFIGGEIFLLNKKKDIFPEYEFLPEETKEIFRRKGWRTICAFQTRNVPHLGHEFLQKEALKYVDGLFIHPLVGKKKIDDFKDEYILASYELLIERYYPEEKVLLGILPLKMYYAGPREAVFHALIRKNFGCTHFIVGRDHAGVGRFYNRYAAQQIFTRFKKEEIGIEILKFPEVIFCKTCRKVTFSNECNHRVEDKISFSGTKVREMLKRKEMPPLFLMRPEVSYLLFTASNSLVDALYRKKDWPKKSFCLWFTGLSQSGKTTLGNAIHHYLRKKGYKVERLDGDIVRQSLAKDLGFTKKERDENLKRVGTLASLFVRKGIIVVASFISPYKSQREELRKRIPNFIEVYCNCPIEVCEKRDAKGFYQKAKSGEIKNFTGVSDPYEIPSSPEIVLNTDKETVDESLTKIINYLKEKNFI